MTIPPDPPLLDVVAQPAPLGDDPTLEEVRAALAPDLAANAAFDGWGREARDLAADAVGVDRDVARLALPDAVAMIDAWFASIDAAMAVAVPMAALAGMKVRERIASQVEARLTIAAPDREALRRAIAVLALPTNVAAGARLGWRTADLIWRRAGDKAVDLNHYTKRASLLAIYAATAAVFLDDDSEDQADTRAFLHRRIDGLLRLEGVKARLRAQAAFRPSLSRFVGRLRYPAV